MAGPGAAATEPLLQALRRAALRRPEGVAVVDREGSLSWSALLGAATRGALRLREAGVGPGDRVLLHLDRSVAFAAAYLAVHGAGAVCVIPPSDAPEMAQEAAARTDAALALTLTEGAWDGPARSVAALCAPGPEGGALPELALEQTADILYTTGTTGEPKGVVLSHGNVAAATANICALLQQEEDDVELCPIPLTHSFGLGRLRCAIWRGSTLVIEPGLRSLGETLAAARRHRATALSLPPAGLALLRRARADGELAALGETLRFVELLGAPLPAEVRDWALSRLPGARLCHHYGLTEASRAAGVELASPEGRAGAVGRPAPGVTIEVRDEAGGPVAAGESGELWIRGAIVAQGYWRQPERSAEAFVGGAVRTRDLGRIDEEGRIFLQGRLSDLINVGGVKVAPQEIEGLLAQHPAVLDVACAPIPDPAGISGERVGAFVVAARALTLGELAGWLRERGVEGHRLPARLELLPSLPRTPAGKLLRRLLPGPR